MSKGRDVARKVGNASARASVSAAKSGAQWLEARRDR